MLTDRHTGNARPEASETCLQVIRHTGVTPNVLHKFDMHEVKQLKAIASASALYARLGTEGGLTAGELALCARWTCPSAP